MAETDECPVCPKEPKVVLGGFVANEWQKDLDAHHAYEGGLRERIRELEARLEDPPSDTLLRRQP